MINKNTIIWVFLLIASVIFSLLAFIMIGVTYQSNHACRAFYSIIEEKESKNRISKSLSELINIESNRKILHKRSAGKFSSARYSLYDANFSWIDLFEGNSVMQQQIEIVAFYHGESNSLDELYGIEKVGIYSARTLLLFDVKIEENNDRGDKVLTIGNEPIIECDVSFGKAIPKI